MSPRSARTLGAYAASRIKAGNLAYTIGSGGDFADLAAAIAYLNGLVILQTSAVTLTVLDGTITATAPVLVETPFGRQITVQGQNAYTKTLSSVQSSSGSAGAWSIVLNVTSVANIEVNNYAVFPALTGGTNPSYLAGAWKVTNVDAVNTRITISSTHKAAAAPSGNVTGSFTVLKSVLKFTGSDGLQIWNGGVGINLNNLVIAGDGSGSRNGVANDDTDRVYVPGLLAVVGFGGNGFQALQNSETNSDGTLVASSNGNVGFSASQGGSIAGKLIASGNGGDGVVAQLGGVVYASGGSASVSSGNTANGWHATTDGTLFADGSQATGNTLWGYLSDAQGYVSAATPTTANNGSGASSIAFAAAGAALTGNFSVTGLSTLTGATTVAGTSLSLTNASPSTSFTALNIDSNGQAKVLFRDGLLSGKWELGHGGSSNSYDFSLYNDGLSAAALTITAVASKATFAGAVVAPSVKTTGATLSGLGSASTAGAGTRGWVTDATQTFTAANFGTTVTSGGANGVPVVSDGTNWKIG